MITKISPGIAAIDFHNFGSIVYFLQFQNKNILVDTSSKENSKELINLLPIKPEEINTIILTHAHWDHVENIDLFPNAKIYGNFTKVITRNHSQTKEEKIIPIDKLKIKEIKIYKTPGHTQGDILILYKNILFSGDVIFHDGYIGRTDLPESNPEIMIESLNFIKTLKFDTLCPGH